VKLNFEAHFTVETPGNTLTIKATGTMQPGRPAYISGPPEDCYPAEDDEIVGDPEIIITGKNGKTISFERLPKKVQEQINEGIYTHAVTEPDEPHFYDYE
jgi:hypothetical protein